MEDYKGREERQEDVYELIETLPDRYDVLRSEILKIGDKLGEAANNEFTYSELEAAVQQYEEKNVEPRYAAFLGMIKGGNIAEGELLEPDDAISAEEIRESLSNSINSINIGSTVR